MQSVSELVPMHPLQLVGQEAQVALLTKFSFKFTVEKLSTGYLLSPHVSKQASDCITVVDASYQASEVSVEDV